MRIVSDSGANIFQHYVSPTVYGIILIIQGQSDTVLYNFINGQSCETVEVIHLFFRM
jgi:hypothetical protein